MKTEIRFRFYNRIVISIEGRESEIDRLLADSDATDSLEQEFCRALSNYNNLGYDVRPEDIEHFQEEDYDTACDMARVTFLIWMRCRRDAGYPWHREAPAGPACRSNEDYKYVYEADTERRII